MSWMPQVARERLNLRADASIDFSQLEAASCAVSRPAVKPETHGGKG